MIKRENNKIENHTKVNWLEQNQHITIGLGEVISVMKPEVYRAIGSLVPLSLEGPYRRAGDIDLLVDAKERDRANGLTSLGYSARQVKGFENIIGIKLTRFTKGPTEIDMFFGDITQDGGWRLPLKGGFHFYIPPAIWQRTPLRFGGIEFSSISPTAAQYIISLLEHNKGIKHKSRALDLAVLERHGNPSELARIQEEKPGLYYNGHYIPINQLLISLGNLALILEGHKK